MMMRKLLEHLLLPVGTTAIVSVGIVSLLQAEKQFQVNLSTRMSDAPVVCGKMLEVSDASGGRLTSSDVSYPHGPLVLINQRGELVLVEFDQDQGGWAPEFVVLLECDPEPGAGTPGDIDQALHASATRESP